MNIEAENVIIKVNENTEGLNSIWHPEYAKFKCFLQVESNMRARREAISKHLKPQDRVLSIANFPGLGTVSAFNPSTVSSGFTNEASRSCFIPDEVINSHARFK